VKRAQTACAYVATQTRVPHEKDTRQLPRMVDMTNHQLVYCDQWQVGIQPPIRVIASIRNR